MITVKEKIRLIESCFGDAKITADNKNAVVFCPMCKAKGKDKRKLAIGIDNGVYHCWVCESKGRNIGRIALKYSIQKKAATDLYTYFKKDTKDDDQIAEEEKKAISLPEDFRLVAKDRSARTRHAAVYLKDRGFKEEDLWRFRVGISEEYSFRNRVIFPSYDAEQNLNFFTARATLKDIKRRYHNCTASRKEVIFREFDIDFSKELILTEGVFDLLHTPENSTCLLGSWMDEKYALFKKIVKNNTPVILCLDEDAMSKTQKIASKLYSYNVDVKISQHTGKDFGDMKKSEVEYYINNAKPYDNVDRVSYLINTIRSGSMF